jgi:hypothetical protein
MDKDEKSLESRANAKSGIYILVISQNVCKFYLF